MSTTAIFSLQLTSLLSRQKRYNERVLFRQLPLPAEMWKNIFIESCLLSALIFGGFYIQSNIIKSEINLSDQAINESLSHKKLMHISGGSIYPELIVVNEHLSGVKTKLSIGHVSGKEQFSTTKEP